MSKHAPLREVTKIHDLEGPLGGSTLVYELTCGHIIWQRKPKGGGAKTALRCISCWVQDNNRLANG